MFPSLPLLATLLAAAPAAPPADRLAVTTVVDRMQRAYDSSKSLTAKFTQRLTNAALGRTKVATGTVSFRKPGQMRWDYVAPEQQMWLFTGQVGWVYQPRDKQAFRQDARKTQLPAALSFMSGKGKLKDEFDITVATDSKVGRPEDYKLALKPKQPQSNYKSIVFVVDPKTFLVNESVLTDAAGGVNHFSFADVKIDTKIPDATFKWSPPAGVKEIDVAKLGQPSKR